MKKILFALLIFAFVGCESGIGTGELYLRKLGNNSIGYDVFKEGGDSVVSGTTRASMYITLPEGKYEVSAYGVNLWEGESFLMKNHKITIRKDEITTLDIAF